MADTKISALSSATALDGTEVIPVVQSSTTKKTPISAVLLAAASGNVVGAVPGIGFAAVPTTGFYRYNAGAEVLAAAVAGVTPWQATSTFMQVLIPLIVPDATSATEALNRQTGDARYQPIDSDLTAIAALTTTAYGRAVLALADQAALMALLSSASTTAEGKVELATSAETITGSDTARAVTPAGAAAAYQPLDSDLTAIAALTTTAFGRSVLAAADAAALRTLAGTVIGTNVQAWDADLDAVAALTTPATTISGAAQKASNLSDLANAATAFGNIKQAATAAATGVVELATDAELATGTDTTRAVTPANVAALVASATARGIVELATTAETQTQTDTVRAVTPAGLGGMDWQSYTPAIVQSGAVTKTIDYAKYFVIGKMVTVIFRMTVTANGTTNNAITVSLPVTAATSGIDVGVFSVYDGSVPARYVGIANLLTTTTVQGILHSLTLATAIGQNPNFALANAQDIILGSITYPAA